MGVSEFLIKQVVDEDIYSFKYKMRKGQFLLHPMKKKKKDNPAKLFKKFNHSFQMDMFWFSEKRKILPNA